MSKFVNILMLLLVVIFTFSILKYYSSSKNIENKDFNRLNIDKILEEKINELPILANDTENVIEFNNSIESEIKNEKKRTFWNLLKNK